MNQSSNEKPIDFDCCIPPLFSFTLLLYIGGERSVFRIEFIIRDSFSAKSH